MNSQKPGQQGPDPAISEAVHRLNRTQLSPLEEVMFQSWANANQVEDADSHENGLDMRGIYKQTGGKVLPPGQLKQHAERATDIQTLMQAQEAHEASSPIKAMMEAQQRGGGQALPGGMSGGMDQSGPEGQGGY